MSDLTHAPFIDGYSGFPIETRPEHGAQRGTVEWLLNALDRHASAVAPIHSIDDALQWDRWARNEARGIDVAVSR